MSRVRTAVALAALLLITGCSTGGTKVPKGESAALTEVSSDVRMMAVELESYFVDNDTYPSDQEQFDAEVVAERTDFVSVFEYTYIPGVDGGPGEYTLCATSGGAFAAYSSTDGLGEAGLGITCP